MNLVGRQGTAPSNICTRQRSSFQVVTKHHYDIIHLPAASSIICNHVVMEDQHWCIASQRFRALSWLSWFGSHEMYPSLVTQPPTVAELFGRIVHWPLHSTMIVGDIMIVV
eukprot:scaffold128924_cov16-Prasinocladus_malaysianus.AAC.1